jgi:hypothetical protein
MVLSRILEDLDFFHSAVSSAKPLRSFRGDAYAESVLTYEMDGQQFTLERMGNQARAFSRGSEISLRSVHFPTKAIAVAHLPVDRFKFSRGKENFYAYLGLRQSSNLTTTGALEVKVASALLASGEKPGFRSFVRDWLSNLGLGLDVFIVFDGIDHELFDTSSYSLDRFYVRAHELGQRRNGRYRSVGFDEFLVRYRHELDATVTLFAQLRSFAKIDPVRSGVSARINALDAVPDPAEMLGLLEAARRIRLVPELRVELDRGRAIGFSELSSGEQQILGTMVRVLSEIEPYSIIAIDEPEVSLHPSWQQEYIPNLQRMLRSFPNTHVLIATHSHFLVSDVHQDQSTLIVASREGKQFQLFDGETYGRSAENILYRVFGMAATSNAFLEKELLTALQMISGTIEPETQRLLEIRSRLERAVGTDNEAIGEIITGIDSFLEERE